VSAPQARCQNPAYPRPPHGNHPDGPSPTQEASSWLTAAMESIRNGSEAGADEVQVGDAPIAGSDVGLLLDEVPAVRLVLVDAVGDVYAVAHRLN